MYKKQREEAIAKNGLFLDYKGININSISNGWGFVLKEVCISVCNANQINEKVLRVKRCIEQDLKKLGWETVHNETPKVIIYTFDEFKEVYDKYPSIEIKINNKVHHFSGKYITADQILKLAGIPKKDWVFYFGYDVEREWDYVFNGYDYPKHFKLYKIDLYNGIKFKVVKDDNIDQLIEDVENELENEWSWDTEKHHDHYTKMLNILQGAKNE